MLIVVFCLIFICDDDDDDENKQLKNRLTSTALAGIPTHDSTTLGNGLVNAWNAIYGTTSTSPCCGSTHSFDNGQIGCVSLFLFLFENVVKHEQ
jgi:hypothetical protein